MNLTTLQPIIEQIIANAAPTPTANEGQDLRDVLTEVFDEYDALLEESYLTETEINDLLDTKASVAHNHDSLYYQKTEVYTKEEVDLEIAQNAGKPSIFEGVSDETSMLALNAFKGDHAIRTDITQTFVLKQTPATNIANWVQLEISAAPDATKQSISEKNQPSGYAGLDGSGKIAVSALPTSVMEYKGLWNASTNSPTLADGTGDAGDVYIVSVGATRNLGSGNITFAAGDWVTYNGTIWQLNNASPSAIHTTLTANRYYETVNAITIANDTATIDIANGTFIPVTITYAGGSAGITLTISGMESGKAGYFTLHVLSGSTAKNLIFPAGTVQETTAVAGFEVLPTVKRNITTYQRVVVAYNNGAIISVTPTPYIP